MQNGGKITHIRMGLQTSYWFGMPRDVLFAGLAMDVDHLAIQATTKGDDQREVARFVHAVGVRASVLEHLVPEEIFGTESSPTPSISAVKALVLAGAEGQKMWSVDSDNLDTALAAIDLGTEIEMDIRNAVYAGKVITTHSSPVAFAGGTNVGYLLIDPVTGAGAFKISGGGNGSETRMPANGPSGIGMHTSIAPALVLGKMANGGAVATFFGKVKCKMSGVLITMALAVALMAAAYAFSSVVRMLSIPSLAPLAAGPLKAMIIAALGLAGVANAADVYERDCECASGIISEYGQCWTCSPESHPTIRGRVNNAKAETGSLGRCLLGMGAVDILIRIGAWEEFKDARIAENACWEPPHQGHLDQVRDAQVVINRCIGLLPQ